MTDAELIAKACRYAPTRPGGPRTEQGELINTLADRLSAALSDLSEARSGWVARGVVVSAGWEPADEEAGHPERFIAKLHIARPEDACVPVSVVFDAAPVELRAAARWLTDHPGPEKDGE